MIWKIIPKFTWSLFHVIICTNENIMRVISTYVAVTEYSRYTTINCLSLKHLLSIFLGKFLPLYDIGHKLNFGDRTNHSNTGILTIRMTPRYAIIDKKKLIGIKTIMIAVWYTQFIFRHLKVVFSAINLKTPYLWSFR